MGAAPVLAALPAGTLSVALPVGVQNGAPDGLRLVDRNAGVTLDGVAYEGELAGVGEGASAPEDLGPRALARFPNGADTDDNGADFRLRAPSPGVSNLDTPTLAASVTPVEVQIGELFTLTVELPTPAGAGGVVVDVASAPFEAVLPVDALVVPEGAEPGMLLTFQVPKDGGKKKKKEFLAQERSAILIQKHMRGAQARKQVPKPKVDEPAVVVCPSPQEALDKAATKVQSCYRGLSTRNKRQEDARLQWLSYHLETMDFAQAAQLAITPEEEARVREENKWCEEL